MPQAAPYAAAKAGVNSLTASMAGAWTGRGVRVNAIAVGAVRAASLVDDLARSGQTLYMHGGPGPAGV